MAGAIMSSKRDDWCTPPEMLAPVRKFFGGQIDLDPCWNEGALTEARVCFDLTQGFDGLVEPWGKVRAFVNPPWGRVIGKWVQKACTASTEAGAGVVMLLPANTDTLPWQNLIFPSAQAICFIKGRVTFLDPETRQPAEQGVTKGAAFVYFGRRPYQDFRVAFGPLGHVIGRVVPPSQPSTAS